MNSNTGFIIIQYTLQPPFVSNVSFQTRRNGLRASVMFQQMKRQMSR